MSDKWNLTEVAPEQVAHKQFAPDTTHAPIAIVNPPDSDGGTPQGTAPVKREKTTPDNQEA